MQNGKLAVAVGLVVAVACALSLLALPSVDVPLPSISVAEPAALHGGADGLRHGDAGQGIGTQVGGNRTVAVKLAEAIALPAELRLQLSIRWFCCSSNCMYLGPLRVECDGQPVFAGEVRRAASMSLKLPSDARELVLLAPDHEPLLQVLPPARENEWQCEVTLVPTSRLLVELHEVPLSWRGEIQLALHCGVAGGIRMFGEAADAVRTLEVPCVPGHAVDWQVQMSSASSWGRIAGHELALAAGERRVLKVPIAPSRRHRVMDVPAAALPELCIHWVQGGAMSGPFTDELQVRDDGSFDVWGELPDDYYLRTVTASITLTADHRSDETLLRPVEPVVAIGFLGASHAAVPTRVLDAAGQSLTKAHTVHVFREPVLGSKLVLSPDAELPALLTVPLVHSCNGVLWLAREAEPERGTIKVQLLGTPVAGAHGEQLTIEAFGGQPPHAHNVTACDGAVLPVPPGRYELRFSLHGQTASIADDLVVQAGQQHCIAAWWPSVATWRGQIANYDKLPDGQRGRRVEWSDGSQSTAVLQAATDQHGRFEILLLNQRFPEAVWLRSGLRLIRARAEYDEAAKSISVHVVPRTRLVNLQVAGCDEWRVMLGTNETSGFRIQEVRMHGRPDPIAMYEDESLSGVLLGGRTNEVVAWFELDGSQSQVVLERARGRTVSVALAAGVAAQHFGMIGPAGQFASGVMLVPGEPQQVFVPEGTAKLWFGDRLLEVPSASHWLLQ